MVYHCSTLFVASVIVHYNLIRMACEYVNIMDNVYIFSDTMSINMSLDIESRPPITELLHDSNIDRSNRIRMAGEYVNIMDNAYIFSDTLSINKHVHIDSDLHISDVLVASNI